MPVRRPPASLLPAAAGLGLAALAAAGWASAGRAAEPLGDVDRGAALFDDCAGCHDVGREAEHRVGPHLNGVFGRRAGGLDDFEAYSRDILRAGDDGLVWTAETLDLYVSNPRIFVSGTRMNYEGMADAADRADLIAYLRRFSDDPSDIPEAAPTATGRGPELEAEILALEGDPAWGGYLAGECVGCHRADGGDAGIPSIAGWPERDFVVAMHAYKREHRPHPVMRMIAARLADEEIAALAAYFADLR